MSVVLLNKRRPDEYGLRFDAPPPPSSSEWFLDSQFVPGTDFAEDPWLDFETELKKHTMSQAAIFGCAAMALDVMEPPLRLDGVKQEEHSPEVVEQVRNAVPAHLFTAPQQPASLSSSASLSAVLRTCHHCKTVRTCQPCVCSRTFCDRCIEKYPSIPQTPDPSGFRQQCPHCQELCTCARCRQRRAEESAPARARAQRSAAVKRQASEEDEDYGGARLDREVEIVVRLPDTLAPPAAAAAASTAADDEDLDACGSLKGDDVSLSPLGPCSSSSSCGSRISFKLRTSDDGMHHTVDRVVSLQQVKRLRTAPAALSQPLTTVAPVLCAPVAEQADQTSLRTSAKPEGSSDSGASDEPDNEESADEGYAPASADAAAAKSAARVKKARRPAEGAPRPRTMGRKGSVDGGAALPGVAAPTCKECGTRTTPLWRAGPDGTKSLCNRCGIRWMRGVPLTRSPPAKTCHAGAEEDASEARARQVPCK